MENPSAATGEPQDPFVKRLAYGVAPRGQTWRRFRLTAPLVGAGDVIEESSLTSISLGVAYCELTIGIGRDHTAQLLVPLDACLAHPDLFQELPPQ